MIPVSNLEIVNNKQANRFEARVQDELAVLEYHLSSNVIILNHTEVPQHLEGQGVGSVLIKFVLDDARANQYSVVPMCPFVAAYIRRHQEYRDLVPERFWYMVS
jgi:uncharacterized protein